MQELCSLNLLAGYTTWGLWILCQRTNSRALQRKHWRYLLPWRISWASWIGRNSLKTCASSIFAQINLMNCQQALLSSTTEIWLQLQQGDLNKPFRWEDYPIMPYMGDTRACTASTARWQGNREYCALLFSFVPLEWTEQNYFYCYVVLQFVLPCNRVLTKLYWTIWWRWEPEIYHWMCSCDSTSF